MAGVSDRLEELEARTDADFADTLVWLCGREPGRDGAHGIGLRTIRPAGGYVEMDGYEMRPETAVDLARALLAAALRASDASERGTR